MLRVVPCLRPLRPSRCRNDATVRGAPICSTWSRSPTSMPSSSVDVDTMTQSRVSVNAVSARRRSSTDSEECETKVYVPCSRSASARDSTVRRASANTRRFSPRCSEAMTMAALATVPT